MQYKAGESVLVNPDEAKSPPFIGRIKEIIKMSATDDDDIEITVAWFYRPEEAVGGRKTFHGEREVFSSDHLDTVHKNTVIGKCRVHTLKKYEALAQVTDQDFFSRFNYKPANKEFEPDRVPVYCICEQPYNPDKKMVLCDGCEEWFHVECVNETQASVDSKPSWFCPDCKAEGKADTAAAKKARLDGGSELNFNQPPFVNPGLAAAGLSGQVMLAAPGAGLVAPNLQPQLGGAPNALMQPGLMQLGQGLGGF